MDLNFCTVCYRETSGSLYCSELCRLDDVAAVEEDQTLPSSPRDGSSSHRLRTFSGSSSSEEELERDHFVLPGRRNAGLGGPHFAAPSASRKLASRHPAGTPSRRPFGGTSRGGAAPLDEEDPELDFLSRLTPPIGLEHRERYRERIPEKHERYIFKRGFL